MNNQRRMILKHVNEDIERVLDILNGIRDTIEDVKNDEESAYDNLPYSLQDSERGCVMQEAIDNLDSLLDSVDDAVSTIEECSSCIEDIRYN